MYQAWWGLKRSPFSAHAAGESLAASPVHAEAIARLEFLRDSHSRFGLVLGPAGSGKSAVLHELARRTARTGTVVSSLSAAAAEEDHLLGRLAIDLGVAAGGPLPLWLRLADRLEELELESLAALVLLDDLDLATAGGLAVVERLLALTAAPLTIVASVRPERARRLGRRLLDHVALRTDLAPWNEEETRHYLDTTLAAAGRSQPAFDEAAVRRLFELSHGTPRRVNQLAQLALLAGASQQLTRIDAETIDAVEEELSVRV